MKKKFGRIAAIVLSILMVVGLWLFLPFKNPHSKPTRQTILTTLLVTPPNANPIFIKNVTRISLDTTVWQADTVSGKTVKKEILDTVYVFKITISDTIKPRAFDSLGHIRTKDHDSLIQINRQFILQDYGK